MKELSLAVISVAEEAIPGAVVVVGTQKGLIKAETYGYRKLGEVPQPMTLDTAGPVAVEAMADEMPASIVVEAAPSGFIAEPDDQP